KLPAAADQEKINVIVPRKAVMDLMRLLEDSDGNVTLAISDSHLKIVTPDVIFISKLIEGQFPEYNNVIPKHGNKLITLDREMFKQLLARAAILTNEQFRG